MNPSSYIILGKKELTREKFSPVKSRVGLNKPEGGLWASPYYPDKEYISSWHEWCAIEMDNWLSNDSVILTVKDNARIFTIDSQEDLLKFINIVGVAEDEIMSKISYRFASPNFEKAKELFDVIYLSENGQWKTRFSCKECQYNLYGWDCESVLILNFDCIDKWEYKKLDIV